MKYLVLAAVFACLWTTQAEARHRHATGLDPSCNVTMPCQLPMSAAAVRESERVARGKYVARQIGIGGVAPVRHVHHRKEGRQHSGFQPEDNARRQPHIRQVAATRYSEIVAHPSGCPTRAFCGCGAAVRIFGAPVRALWLAANWFKFPRATPAPGMAAVRRHHVMVLETDLGGGIWQVYDANSGGHATRIHARSIAGYAIVNPRG